jgi:hypothetical protein
LTCRQPASGVVGGADRVVLDTDDGHPIRGSAEVAGAGLAHGPGGLGVRALPPRAPFGRVDAGGGEELVEVVEALAVADLGEQGRSDRGSDPRDRLEPTGCLAVEESGPGPPRPAPGSPRPGPGERVSLRPVGGALLAA